MNSMIHILLPLRTSFTKKKKVIRLMISMLVITLNCCANCLHLINYLWQVLFLNYVYGWKNMHRIKNIKTGLVFHCQEMGTLDLTKQETNKKKNTLKCKNGSTHFNLILVTSLCILNSMLVKLICIHYLCFFAYVLSCHYRRRCLFIPTYNFYLLSSKM